MEIIDGRYEILEPLGTGADAEVFRVVNRRDGDRPLALKLLRPGAVAPLRAEALRLEFTIFSQLRHPHLVEVYDFARDAESGRYFYTMEIVPGTAIDEGLESASAGTVLAACVAVAAALDRIHAAGFVHGDLKPSNIRLTPEGRVCVLDAGMAVAAGRSAAPSGTALYMAPERIRGEPVGFGCDLYAMGVLLYRLLLGRHPFEGTYEEILSAHVHRDPTPPRALRPDLPWSQQALILSLLAKDPAERPRSAAVVRARLEETPEVGARPRIETAPMRTGPLVGRDELLTTLRRRLRASLGLPGRREGPAGPCVLLVEGEAGSGRSRLLAELRAALAVEGVRPTSLPRGRSALPEASERPVLWLGDDVDRAEAPEADAIDELVTSVLVEAAAGHAARLAIVLTGTPGTRLTARVEHYRLRPLDVDEVRALAAALSGHHVEEETAKALHAATGGNAALVESVVLAAPDRLDEAPSPTAPPDFWRAWDALPPDGRDLLRVLALARVARAKALADTCGMRAEDAWALLRPLEVSGFLRREDDRFRFAQDLSARAVLSRLDDARRRALTERWCGRLEAGDPDRVRLLVEAGLPADDEAVAAAKRLRRIGRAGQALALLEPCRAAADTPSGALLSAMVELAIDLADGERAASLLEALETLHPPGGPKGSARRARWAAAVAFFRQDLEETHACLERAESRLEDGEDPVERVRLEGMWATVCAHAGRTDEAIRHTEKMERHARQAGRPADAGVALGKRAVIVARLGRYEETVSLLRRSVEQFEAAGDEAGRLSSTHNLALAALTLGDLPVAEDAYRRALAAALAHGDRFREAGARTGLAEVLLERGPFDEAERLLDRAAAVERVFEFDPVEGLLLRARLASARGDVGGALRYAAQGREAARSPSDRATASAHEALLRLRVGDEDGARRALETADGGPLSEAWLLEAAGAALDADLERFERLATRLDDEGRRLAAVEVRLLTAEHCLSAPHDVLERARVGLEGLGARPARARYGLLAGAWEEAVERARALDMTEIQWRASARRGRKDEEALALAEAWVDALEPEEAACALEDPDLVALRESTKEAPMQDRDRFRALTEICEAVGVLQDLDALLQRTLEVVVHHLQAERVIVFLWNPETQELEARAVRGVEEAHLPDATTVSRSALTQALEGGGVLHVADARGPGESDPSRSMARYGIRSLVAAPIVVRGQPVGVVYADSRAQAMPLESEDLAFVDAICKQIGVAVENARLYGRVQGEAEAMERVYGPIVREIRDRYSTRNLIGRSPAFRGVLDLVDRLETGHTTVLVLGENGTGKELIARTIHYQSDRRDRPFVALNCAALPEELLESELFGIERGVATGVDSRSGRFEDADGGTLLLDEVGDMAPAVQAKVLRVLQERLVERVGGKETIPVDVRVIAATSRDLEAMIKTGGFREDLYFRLAVFPIVLPPLRERREDVPDLARHFLSQAAAEHGRGTLVLSDGALDALVRHEWPGNVRELQNVIERAVLLASGSVIGLESFAGALGASRDAGPSAAVAGGVGRGEAVVDEALCELPYEEARRVWTERFERAYIEHALRAHDGNVSRAAAAVGLRRQRAYEILGRLGLKADDYRDPGVSA